MRLLVLGGNVFLSREVAAVAAARGHDVTAANRGRAGATPEGVRLVVADRDAGLPAALTQEEFDVVVDVARRPSHVRRAVAAWPDAHWVFVSTISVYADDATPGGGPGTLPLHAPEPDDVDLAEHPEAYGPCKVDCEESVRDGVESHVIVRPGLIVGPGDPSGRFAYWVARMGRVGHAPEVLAPGTPADQVQVVDVRDLAAWLVDLGEARTQGVLDGVGPVTTFQELLDGIAAGCGATPTFRWVPDAELEAAGVQPWAGDRSLPVWLPRPEYDGMLAHDPGPARAAGLRTRPVAETAADTLAWLRATPDARVTGLTADEEAQVLAGRQR
ncbi:epimerase [Sorangium cellulosum]|uniref:NAD-dependent epimerase/dehydratase family protein n=1 Tax=Sorangium cellulosum TaxID=56 RepID=UPI003D9A8B27